MLYMFQHVRSRAIVEMGIENYRNSMDLRRWCGAVRTEGARGAPSHRRVVAFASNFTALVLSV